MAAAGSRSATSALPLMRVCSRGTLLRRNLGSRRYPEVCALSLRSDGPQCHFSRAKASSAGPGPPNEWLVWGTRAAVGLAGALVTATVFDVARGRFYGGNEPSLEQLCEWDEAWDDVDLAQAGGAQASESTSPGAAAFLAADKLRSTANKLVGQRHVVFIRHGQPKGSSTNLSAAGERQAKLTGERLQRLRQEIGAAMPVTVFHPGAGEALATAEALKNAYVAQRSDEEIRLSATALLAEGIPVLPSPLPEALEGLKEEEVALDMARAEGALRAFFWRPTGDTEEVAIDVIVSHGNLIRYLVCRALQLPPSVWSRLAAHHCAITWLEIGKDGAVRMHEFGGVGHLPPELITY